MKADASIWNKGKVCPPERARGNDPHLKAQRFELPRPVMPFFGKLAPCLIGVDLENVLRKIKTNRDNFTHGRLPFLVVAGNHNHGTIDAGG